MESFKLKIENILTLLGLSEPTVNVDIEGRHIDIFVNEGSWIKKWLPELIFNMDCVVRLMAKKEGLEYFLLDINGYSIQSMFLRFRTLSQIFMLYKILTFLIALFVENYQLRY